MTISRNKRRPLCENSKKVINIKDTCSKIHGKPDDWKPKHSNDHDGRAYMANVACDNSVNSESTPFRKEQIDALQMDDWLHRKLCLLP